MLIKILIFWLYGEIIFIVLIGEVVKVELFGVYWVYFVFFKCLKGDLESDLCGLSFEIR